MEVLAGQVVVVTGSSPASSKRHTTAWDLLVPLWRPHCTLPTTDRQELRRGPAKAAAAMDGCLPRTKVITGPRRSLGVRQVSPGRMRALAQWGLSPL